MLGFTAGAASILGRNEVYHLNFVKRLKFELCNLQVGIDFEFC